MHDRAGKGPTVAGFHWPDSCQVPVSPRQITEVGYVPSPDLWDGRVEAEELKCTWNGKPCPALMHAPSQSTDSARKSLALLDALSNPSRYSLKPDS